MAKKAKTPVVPAADKASARPKTKPGPKKLALKKRLTKAVAKRAGAALPSTPKLAPKLARVLARRLDRVDASDASLSDGSTLDGSTLDGTVLDRLAATVTSRRTADPAVSHSARLMARGTAKVAQKFGEEAVECLIEAVAGNRDALVAESADVLYHLIVLWVDAGLDPARVWEELHRREGISGIAEKARRKIVLPTTKIP